ncbi:MAG: hypothetical protein JXA49_04045 [Actinobacteria bacterium]|nr:hypothetical protein [Actinomycetota bacterium]
MGKESEMQCDCYECKTYGGPDPSFMRFRLGTFFAQFGLALFGLAWERKWKTFAATIGSLVFFFTLPRYLICARCPGYGKRCYSLYLGLATSRVMPRVEGKKVKTIGLMFETMALTGIGLVPITGLLGNLKMLVPYMVLLDTTLGTQFIHACRHCAYNAAEDSWQYNCPVRKIACFVYNPEGKY